MALDFSDFEVTDPHEPEFHKAVAGQRVVFYYGTTTAHFWEIMRNGIHAGSTTRKVHPDTNPVSLHQNEAKHNAYRMARSENNDQHEGPIEPMIIVGETKFEKPLGKGASEMDQFISGTEIGAEANSLLPTHIKPNAINGVFYPKMENTWETPIKKFIEMVQWGEFPAIPSDENFKRGRYRPTGPTKENWQNVIIRYASDLLNYSINLYDYLTWTDDDPPPVPYHDTIIREASKLGLQKMLHWTGLDMMKWLYSILPSTRPDSEVSQEDDIKQVMDQADYMGWNRPLYQLWKKYSDDTTWEYRTGKKTYSPHE
jgi:hypothetical protein